MLRSLARVSLLALLPAVQARAQSIHIVNANTNGPGALDATVNNAAVQSGDTLRILAGYYWPTTITGKALNLIADGSVQVERILISGIPAGQTLTLSGISFTGQFNNGVDDPVLAISSSSGGVFASGCSFTGKQQRASGTNIATRCVVSVQDATFYADQCSFFGTGGQPSNLFGDYFPSAGLCVVRSTAALAKCNVLGGNGSYTSGLGGAFIGHNGGMAVQSFDSVLILNHCNLAGGTGGIPFGGIICNTQPGGRGGAAINCSSGDKILAAGNTTTLVAGFTPTPMCTNILPSPAVIGTGEITLDPVVRLTPNSGAPAVDARMASISRPICSLSANQSSIGRGQNASWVHRDLAGSYAFTIISTKAYQTIPHPAIFGGLHVDFGLAIIEGPMLVPSTGVVTLGFQVPNDPALAGARVFVETVGIDFRSQPTSTPPSGLFVRF